MLSAISLESCPPSRGIRISGKPIAPMMDVAMCREASAINHRIAFDESAAAQANECLSELMSSYGICPPGCNH